MRDTRAGAATLDCLYVLIVSAALYGCFGQHHSQGIPSRALAAVLLFSPVVGGLVLGLRGHVPPIVIHATCGAANAIAAMLPLTVRMSWLNVAQIVPMLGLIAFGAGLSSFAGTELGGIVWRSRRRKALVPSPRHATPHRGIETRARAIAE
jgi:hypothetical protein